MEYHSHRFKDESILFYHKQKLVAVLPAHLEDDMLATHKGLTFGGIICDEAMTFSLMQEVFRTLLSYLQSKRIFKVHYKVIPVCYHQIPACEDVAVLTRLRATLVERDLVSVINLAAPKIEYYRGVRWSIRKAHKLGLIVRHSDDWESFMNIMKNLLEERYGLSPVHTTEEIIKLANLFPSNILLYGVYNEDTLLGGTILYVSDQVVHAQYMGMGSEGKRLRALPFLLDTLFKKYRGKKQYFSFGTSQDGDYINESLYYFKESLGARAMLQDQYLLSFN
ncbi:GNAT family N-acetyltransferase [Sabulibacter ruber]|uniref:GNAT family N-acetyltransferase n=1 Tax=Sabulibacter ruber TaxID=2811901 RepID=UPI001A97B7EB|nr:GNAT family N-acetyltransferase [Sabulibacter ruber]